MGCYLFIYLPYVRILLHKIKKLDLSLEIDFYLSVCLWCFFFHVSDFIEKMGTCVFTDLKNIMKTCVLGSHEKEIRDVILITLK